LATFQLELNYCQQVHSEMGAHLMVFIYSLNMPAEMKNSTF